MQADMPVSRRPQQQPPTTAVESSKRRIGKLSGASSVGSTATVVIWAGSTPATLSATSQTVSAYNRWLALASGTWVIVEYFPHGWEIVQGQC